MMGARLGLPLILLAAALVGGCATTAGRELAVAADNYEARSLEAIAAVDTMARRETAMPARPEREAEDEFVRNLRSLSPDRVDQAVIDLALDPDAVDLGEAEQARTAILDRMRRQHAEFTAIFEEVERAGLLGKRPVAERVPPVLDVLIAQQVGLARTISSPAGRPRLLGLRGALEAEIARVLEDVPDAEKDAALRDLRRRWLEMRAEEERLAASTSASLLTAAATGLALREQVEAYGRLSLAELQSIAQELLGFVGAATGRDLSALNGHVETLAARIQADPDFSQAAKALLERVPVPTAPLVTSRTVGE